MKYLIVSDIHGSLPALEQVLRVYEEEYCEMMLILGDILNYGPRNRIPDVNLYSAVRCAGSLVDTNSSSGIDRGNSFNDNLPAFYRINGIT